MNTAIERLVSDPKPIEPTEEFGEVVPRHKPTSGATNTTEPIGVWETVPSPSFEDFELPRSDPDDPNVSYGTLHQEPPDATRAKGGSAHVNGLILQKPSGKQVKRKRKRQGNPIDDLFEGLE